MLNDENLKQQILKEIDDDSIPNLTTAIKQKYLNQKQSLKTPWYKKPFAYAIGTPILVGGILCAVLIPNMMKINSSNITSGTPVVIQGRKNEIAFGVLSASNIIDSLSSGFSNLAARRSAIDKDEFLSELKIFNPYMKTAETMLNNNFNIDSEVNISEDANYQYKMNINNELGNVIFYYNELLVNEEDEESEYSLNGVFKIDEHTYIVEGEKEIENDIDESEAELELRVYFDEFKKDYIVIKQEIEKEADEEEQSYVYSLFENDIEMFNAEVSFEKEPDESPLVEVKTTHGKENKKESQYRIINDKKGYYCEYEMLNYEGDMNVEIIDSDQGTSYLYKENNLGYTYVLKRN